MNKYIITIIFIIASQIAFSAPQIFVNTDKIDFGNVTAGERIELEANVTNTGDENLIISKLLSSYDNVRFRFAEKSNIPDTKDFIANTDVPKTIKPGETIKIPILFELLQDSQNPSFTVTIRSNDKEAPSKSINIYGTAIPFAIVSQPCLINLRNVPRNKYYVYDFYVSSADINTNFKLINVIAPSNITVFKKEITPKQWRITLKIKTSAKKGSLKQYVKIVTDLPNKPVILFSINQKTL